MPEGKKYTESRALNTPASSASSDRLDTPDTATPPAQTESNGAKDSGASEPPKPQDSPAVPLNIVDHDIENLTEFESRKAKLGAFFVYFSEWRHLKILIGTASTWFLLDIAFYGTNLNQSVLLADIGYSTGSTRYKTLMKNAVGNLIIAVSGYVPGYFVTIFTIERLGRKFIQIQGFLVVALMFGILAGGYTKLTTGGKFACFALAQVWLHLPKRPITSSTRYILTPYSFSSTSGPTPPPSSSQPKSTHHVCVASRTVSLLLSANSVPSCPLSFSTISQARQALDSQMCFGYSLLVTSLVLLLLTFCYLRRRAEMRM
jgi:hypothetical protein